MTVFSHTFKFWTSRTGYEQKDHKVDVVLENVSHFSPSMFEDEPICYFMYMNDGACAQISPEEYGTIMNLMLTVAGR